MSTFLNEFSSEWHVSLLNEMILDHNSRPTLESQRYLKWTNFKTVECESEPFFFVSRYSREICCHVLRIDDSVNRVHMNAFLFIHEKYLLLSRCLSILNGISSAATVLNSHSLNRLLIHIGSISIHLFLSQCYALVERANADFPVRKAFSLHFQSNVTCLKAFVALNRVPAIQFICW